jgi:uncharacterized coiled-coil DUF342 family protein
MMQELEKYMKQPISKINKADLLKYTQLIPDGESRSEMMGKIGNYKKYFNTVQEHKSFLSNIPNKSLASYALLRFSKNGKNFVTLSQRQQFIESIDVYVDRISALKTLRNELNKNHEISPSIIDKINNEIRRLKKICKDSNLYDT